MTQIVVDAELRIKLHDLSKPLELCDEFGRVLARLVPVLDHSQFEPVEPPISAEELQRRRQEPDYSTAEVLGSLDSGDSEILIIDGPGDTNVQPPPEHLVPFLLAERERLLRWLSLTHRPQSPESD